MARFTVDEALGMVLEDELDSGDEDEIPEDPEFPLPHGSDESSTEESGSEGLSGEGV